MQNKTTEVSTRAYARLVAPAETQSYQEKSVHTSVQTSRLPDDFIIILHSNKVGRVQQSRGETREGASGLHQIQD